MFGQLLSIFGKFFAMKKFYLLLLTASFASAQETDAIAEAEMKSAASLTSFAVNPNTLNYDISYHKLEFTVDPDAYFIDGTVTTTYTALSNMSSITFDLVQQLDVAAVYKDDAPLTFTQNNNDELVINFPAVQAAGTTGTVTIYYSGLPGFSDNSFTTSEHNGVPVLSTLSEPYGAKDWWPCKQDLNDKIDSIDVYITAPAQYVAVSNGLEQSQELNGEFKTTHYQHNYPIPAYLIAIAVTNYQVFTQSAGLTQSFPIVNYIYPEDFSEAQGQLAITLPIMDLFETLFEPYPFADEKYGHAQFNFGGGMEHTTVSFMGGFGRNLIAHELAHQWFGNKITCGTWKDIWLNEGFAEYLSGLVIENFDGNTNFRNWKQFKIQNITDQNGGAVYLTEAETNDVGRIFSSRLSYNKGAMVLNMLRLKVGDANFFQAIKNYLADPDLAFSYAVTADLQSHFEIESSMDLDEFFNDWVYKQGYPTYTISGQNIAPGQVRFTVNQAQSHPSVSFFEMPLPIRIFGSGGQQADIVIENTSNNQQIIANVPFAITSFQFNPEFNIVTGNNSVNLSTDDLSLAQMISVSPNPAKDVLQITIPNSMSIREVIVHNTLGQEVFRDNDRSVDVSSLSSGIHFVTVETETGKATLKFIKE